MLITEVLDFNEIKSFNFIQVAILNMLIMRYYEENCTVQRLAQNIKSIKISKIVQKIFFQ